MGELRNKKKSRSGHKSYSTHALNKVDECLADNTPERKDELAQWKESLQEQLQKVTTLSDQILALMEADEELTDEDLSTELMDTNTLKFDVKMRLSAIEKIVTANVANVTNVPPSLPSPSADLHANQAPFNPWPVPQTATVRAKLPKLEVRKFGGNISEWQEFWDSFESAINRNETLAKTDKFSYLRGLLIEPVRSAIAGFSLTSANYKAAMQLLKKRNGKQNVIQRSYINDLLNLKPFYGERDTQRLRTMYDFAETKHWALDALGVDQETYSAIVLPSLLEKLPEQLRLTITRGEDHHEWNLEQLLDVLGHEVELREEYNRSARHARSPRDESMKKKHTMHTGKQANHQNCAFCLGGHKHEDCQKVKNVSERKQLLIKFGRCFSCIRKGHLSKDCRAN